MFTVNAANIVLKLDIYCMLAYLGFGAISGHSRQIMPS